MNKLRLVGLVTLALSLLFLAASILTGGSQVALFLIFPVVLSHDLMGALGILLLFLSFVLLFLSFSTGTVPEETAEPHPPVQMNEKREFGGVIFIGPIPIIFGSGKELLRNRWFLATIAAIALIMLALTLVFIFL